VPQPNGFRALLYQARGIAGTYGLRQHTVAVMSGAWDGTYTGRGTETATSVAITEGGGQPPKVTWAKDEDIALGQLGEGDAIIGPITPYFGSGGTLITQIAPAVAAGQTVHVVITGDKHPSGAKYRIKDIDMSSALHWTIRCTPVSEVA
jgi:hypothetical protein